MEWYALIFLAIVIEGLVTYTRTLVVDKVFQWQILAAMGLGIGCALAFGVDLFAIAGINSNVPFVGEILTGVVLSRGSNYLFDLIGQITKQKEEAQAADKKKEA